MTDDNPSQVGKRGSSPCGGRAMSSKDNDESADDEAATDPRADAMARKVAENKSDQVTSSRRSLLTAIGAGGVAGLLAGSGTAAAQTSGPGGTAALGEAYPNVYKWANPGGFSGPDAAKSNIPRSVGQMYFAQDTNATYYDDGSQWVDVTPAGSGGTVDTADIADDAVTLPKIDGSAGAAGEVLHSDGTGVFWGTDDTGGTISSADAYSTRLVGSEDPANPSTGFGSEVSTAISNGTPLIRVTGHWTYSSQLTFNSTTDGVDNIPIVIDAKGATIEFSGSSAWAIHDNCQPAANGGRIQNNVFELYGGYWYSTGDPLGWLLMTDVAGNHIDPDFVEGFENTSNNGCGVRFAEGDLFSEANYVSGAYRNVDFGVQCVSSQGTSFQDNEFDHIHLGLVNEAGFNLSGNWIDCLISNPTVIAGANECAFLVQNGNMGGTEIIAPEFEDAQGDFAQLYLVDIGPNASRGPQIRGGDLSLNFNNIAIANTSVYPGDGSGPSGWTLRMDFQRSSQAPDVSTNTWVHEFYSPDGASRSARTGTGVVEETAPFEDNSGTGDNNDGVWDPDWV